MINGVPRLWLQDLSARLLSEQGARRGARALSDRARPGRRHRRLYRQARSDQALHHPEGAPHAGPGRVPADARGARQFEQFSSCINCMLCYAACPQYGLNPDFIGPACWRCCIATTPTPATAARASAGRASMPRTVSGAAPRWATARKSARSRSIRPTRSTRTRSTVRRTISWHLLARAGSR